MHIIEPCCAHRQMADLRKAIRNGGREQICGYGDMSLTELLPALLTGYNETELLIAAPSIPDQAAEAIAKWANHQWARVDGSGNFYELRRLTIIANLSAEQSPKASEWLKENPWEDRLVLIDKAQDDTALLLPDIAITGPLNLRYGQNFTCDVTTVPEEIRMLWQRYLPKAAAQDKEDPSIKDEAPASEEQEPVPAAAAPKMARRRRPAKQEDEV